MTLVKTKSFKLATFSKGNPDSEKLALVLPGRLDTKDYPHMHSHVEYLAARGYLALSFDPPGTWESPGGISLYTMTNYLKAINELIEYFGDKSTFVAGHSRGGSMAMLAGTTNSKITHFVSIMSKYSYTPDVYGGYPDEKWKKDGYRLKKRDIPGSKKIKEFKLPYSFLEDQIQYDMSDGLMHSTKPKMFVFGKKDITVKPEIVKIAYEMSSEPKVLYELDSDHDYRRNQGLINQVNDFIGGFVRKYG